MPRRGWWCESGRGLQSRTRAAGAAARGRAAWRCLNHGWPVLLLRRRRVERSRVRRTNRAGRQPSPLRWNTCSTPAAALPSRQERQRLSQIPGWRADAGGESQPPVPCARTWPGHWERQDEKPCYRCRPVEQRVSRLLSTSFRFRCVSIPSRRERNRFEALLIASLSSCSVCGPSCRWLGQFAYSEVVRSAGMWNSPFVGGEAMMSNDLRRFAGHVDSTPTE